MLFSSQEAPPRARHDAMRLFFLFLLLASAQVRAQEAPPLQEWIKEAVQAGGGVVTVPDGEHVFTETLVIEDAKKLALRGMGREGCVLRMKDAAKPVIEIRGEVERVEIAGIIFQGGAGVRVRGGKDVQVRDCIFEGPGVVMLGARESGVERCSFRDGKGAAVVLDESARQIVIRGNQVTRMALAFDLRAAAECVLEGNEVRDCAAAIRIAGLEPVGAQRHVVRDNGFFVIGGDALVAAAGTREILIEGNEVDQTQGFGFVIAGEGHVLKANTLTGTQAGQMRDERVDKP
ncbi:MAG TPA: hypothetical protein DIT64_06740 [Verrucomicrobiales bacterium]|nr:hypothetical protein [Verrucomicrobiales bacterium]